MMLPQQVASMKRDKAARARLVREAAALEKHLAEKAVIFKEEARKVSAHAKRVKKGGDWDGKVRATCCGAPLGEDKVEPTHKYRDRHKRGVKALKKPPNLPACAAAVRCSRLAEKVRAREPRPAGKRTEVRERSSERHQAAITKAIRRRIDQERSQPGRADCCGAPLGDPDLSRKYRDRHTQQTAEWLSVEPCDAAVRSAKAYYRMKRVRRKRTASR